MQKKLIFLLAFMVLIAIFALQNSVEVEIKLWFWSMKTSMVLVLILTFSAGAIAGILFSLPKRKKDSPDTRESSDNVPNEVNSPGDKDEFEDLVN